MIRGKELIGMPVFSLDQGKEVGEVQDLVFDPVRRRIVGLILEEGGWFRDPEILPYEAIDSIGPDAVVIRRVESSPQPNIGADDLKKSFNLTGKKVISEKGEELGTIHDLYIDDSTGEALGFELTQGLFQDTSVGKKFIEYDHIRNIGEDVVVVDTEGAMKATAQKGGIAKGYESLKEIGSDSVEKAKETLQTVKESSVESLEKAREKSEALALRAREKGEGLTGRILEKKDSWGPSTQETLTELQIKSRDRMARGKKAASRFWENLSRDLERGYEETKRSFERLREQIENHRVEQALGRRISRTILDPSDQVILQQGDIITHQAILQAREAGLLDSILNSVVKENRFLLRRKESESAGEEIFKKRPPIPGQKGERLQKAS